MYLFSGKQPPLAIRCSEVRVRVPAWFEQNERVITNDTSMWLSECSERFPSKKEFGEKHSMANEIQKYARCAQPLIYSTNKRHKNTIVEHADPYQICFFFLGQRQTFFGLVRLIIRFVARYKILHRQLKYGTVAWIPILNWLHDGHWCSIVYYT